MIAVWTAGVLLLVAAFALGWRAWAKRHLFQSPQYLQNEQDLETFKKRLEALAHGDELIGEPQIQALADSGKELLVFFTQVARRFRLDKELQEKIKFCSHAVDLLRQHDADWLLCYQQRRKELENCLERLKTLSHGCELVGGEVIKAFCESARPVLEYFVHVHRKAPPLDEELRTQIRKCSQASEILEQHDAEVLLHKNVAERLRNMLAGPDFILKPQKRTLIEEGWKFRARMKCCDYLLGTTTENVKLHDAAGRKIDEHNWQITAEIQFGDEFEGPFRDLLSETNFRYIAFSEWNPIRLHGQRLAEKLAGRKPLRPATEGGLRLLQAAETTIDEMNAIFVGREAERCKPFFAETIGYALDKQQRDCCVTDEDATLVVAGAGSGKTSVITAKVAYLLKKRGVRPEEIRLITFTTKAAKEMKNRITRCVGSQSVDGLEISTFHKFGKQAIERYGDRKAKPGGDKILESFIHKAMTGEAKFVDNDYSRLVEYASRFLSLEQLEDAFASDSRNASRRIFEKKITLAGEEVKSHEEWLIANFLFLKGIAYAYEADYADTQPDQHNVGKGEYHPDFYLSDYKIYLEHYGVDEQGEPPPWFDAEEKEKYKASMLWKEDLHRAARNRYLKSFSWWHSDGVLLEKLEKELKAAGVKFHPKSAKEVLAILQKKEGKKLGKLEKLLIQFIKLYKTNGYPAHHFDELAVLPGGKAGERARRKSFLALAKQMYILYERWLHQTGQYDFSDMITRAATAVRALPHGRLKYKYVIVDEYQDSTIAQMELVRAVVGNTGAHLFCVGDDWQSIYRFAGSDVSLFTDFEAHFGHAKLHCLENTYRNSQELIDIMGQFVQRNSSQIKKTLKSTKHCGHPVQIVWYGEREGIEGALNRALWEITRDKPEPRVSVYLLGRYNDDGTGLDVPGVWHGHGSMEETAPNPQIQFLTVHSAKGLEADYVILLNAKDDIMGFPSQIEDDPVLRLIQHGNEALEFAEERRLFYVALTRTKNRVFVLAPEKGYSPFVKELLDIMGEPLPQPEGNSVSMDSLLQNTKVDF